MKYIIEQRNLANIRPQDKSRIKNEILDSRNPKFIYNYLRDVDLYDKDMKQALVKTGSNFYIFSYFKEIDKDDEEMKRVLV